MSTYFLLGAGVESHAIVEILTSINPTVDIGFLVEKGFGELGAKIEGYPIKGYLEALQEIQPTRTLIPAILDPVKRMEATVKVEQAPYRWRYAAVRSPHANISTSAFIGAGAIVMPGAIIAEGAHISKYSYIGHGVIIGAGSRIQPFATILAGANLAPKSYIGQGGFIGMGSIVQHGKRIGAWSKVLDASLVTHDVPPGEAVRGNPARKK